MDDSCEKGSFTHNRQTNLEYNMQAKTQRSGLHNLHGGRQRTNGTDANRRKTEKEPAKDLKLQIIEVRDRPRINPGRTPGIPRPSRFPLTAGGIVEMKTGGNDNDIAGLSPAEFAVAAIRPDNSCCFCCNRDGYK